MLVSINWSLHMYNIQHGPHGSSVEESDDGGG